MLRLGFSFCFLTLCVFLTLASFAPAALVNQWSFDDGSGSSATDSVGGKTGTLTNATWTTPGPVPSGSTGALDFNGTDAYVEVPAYYGVTGKNARTVTAWINTSDLTAPVVSWGPDNAGEKFTFRVQDTNGPSGTIRVEVSGGYQVGTTYVADGQWHHVATTWEDDGVNANIGDARLWVDGVLQGVGASKGQAINTAGNTNPVRIGRGVATTKYFDGTLDEVRLFDHAMNRQEIAADAGLVTDAYWHAVQANTPTGYWRLGEPSGGKAFNEGSLGAAVDGGYQNGPNRGQPGLLATVSDTAVTFGGSNEQVNIPDSTSINDIPINQASIETWFNTEAYGGTSGRRVIYEQGGTSNGMNQYISRSGAPGAFTYALRYGAWENTPTSRNHFPTEVPIEVGTNYHAVSTFDEPNKQFILYLNGAPVSAKTDNNIEQLGAATGDIAIGAKRGDTRFDSGASTGNGNPFYGTIDEVAHYNALALDLLSIQTHYVTGSGDRLGIRQDTTLGVALNYDASIDRDGNTTWEDSIGSRTKNAERDQFNWDLGTTGNIPRIDVQSTTLPGITKAYDFDGSHYASTTSFESIAGDPSNESASFEIVFNPSDFTGQEVLFETGGLTNGLSITLDDKLLKFDMKKGAANARSSYDLTGLSFLEQNDFIHVIGVADLDNAQALLYVNGILVDTIAATGTLDDWAGSNNSGLGGTNSQINFGTPGMFTGQIGLVRFYPDLLSADDVMANYLSATQAAVPEPSSSVLAILGLVALGFYRKRQATRA